MTAASPLTLPGSRNVLGWWRELADLRPQRLWFSQVLFHYVEAAVRISHPRQVDPLARALLRALSVQPALQQPEPATGPADPLAGLHLDPQVRAQLLGQLAGAGLLTQAAGRWELTAAGRAAQETGSYTVHDLERRVFPFVDNTDLGRPPHFVPLEPAPSGTPPGVDVPPLEAAVLEACIGEAPGWKARYRFPPEVEALLRVAPGEDPPDWRRVILDRPEDVPLVFAQASEAGAGRGLLGFAVRTEGWVLERAPVLKLPDGWEEVFPDLAEEPAPGAWRQAWLSWCHPRGIPPAEAEACKLEPAGCLLLVRAPQRLIDRLRAARSDAVKNETWLLAGSGRTRAAAQVELHPL